MDLLILMRTSGKLFWTRLVGPPFSLEIEDMKLLSIWLLQLMELTPSSQMPTTLLDMNQPVKLLTSTKNLSTLGLDILTSVSFKTMEVAFKKRLINV